MEEADIVSPKNGSDERCNVGLADSFLLLGLEKLNSFGVNKRGSSRIDFAGLIEEILDRAVGLNAFVLAAAHEFLQLSPRTLCKGLY